MNIVPRISREQAAVTRLRSLAALDAEAEAALSIAVRRPRIVQPRTELLTEGEAIKEPLLILNGWAARTRHLADGRRQIMSFLLPGDLIGLCDQQHPVASSTVVALNAVTFCAAPERGTSASLDSAYAHSRALEEAHLMAHITRLGRMNAHERLADMMLELLERLQRAGCAMGGSYSLPLTQEVLADALGLTSVHINRTLQAMRRDREIVWKGRELTLVNPPLLAERIGRAGTRVSAR